MTMLATKKTRTFPGFLLKLKPKLNYDTITGWNHPFTIGSNIETATWAMAADGRINHHVKPVFNAANV